MRKIKIFWKWLLEFWLQPLQNLLNFLPGTGLWTSGLGWVIWTVLSCGTGLPTEIPFWLPTELPIGLALEPDDTGLVSDAIGLTIAWGLIGSLGDKFWSAKGGGWGGDPVTIWVRSKKIFFSFYAWHFFVFWNESWSCFSSSSGSVGGVTGLSSIELLELLIGSFVMSSCATSPKLVEESFGNDKLEGIFELSSSSVSKLL